MTNPLNRLLRRMPLPDYYKTRLWAASRRPPKGRVEDWAYYRCIELATRAFGTPAGYGVALPGAGDPAQRYSMLEFGVANGNSFQIMLHFRDVWLRRMRLKNRVVALGFDTFEGIPEAREGDRGLPYRAGDFCDVNLAALQDRLAAHNFSNFELVKGRFSDTLPQRTQFLREYTPVFISIDCDYYSSTIDVFDSLIPSGIAPHGCMFYFDDISINFYSEKTGEMRAITELNAGRYGSDICLVEHPLYIETGELRHYRQLWRLFNLREAEKAAAERSPDDRMQAVTLDRISPL